MGLFGNRNGDAQPRTTVVAAPAAPAPTSGESPRRPELARYELKTRVHRQLIERLDLGKLAMLPGDVVQQQIRRIVEDMLADDATPLSRQEREQLGAEVQHETFGLGFGRPDTWEPEEIFWGPEDT